MKLCPTCGEVYSDQSTVCRAHNTELEEWGDVTDTHSGPLTRLDDTQQTDRAGELTEPELHLRRETTPGSSVAIDPALFIDSPKPTRILGERYRLGEHIGIGGYGAVFDAFDERLGKRVAVKVLSPAVAQNAEIVRRFKREAVAASRVRHECVVDVTDFDVDPGGSSFIVMEYLDGRDLSDVLLDDGPLPPARALAIAAQCASALAATHRAGILHRDLKPANIFLVESPSRSDFVKIIDFGISKITNDKGQYSNITSASKVVGTPFYMPPEQARGESLDGRTDIYALGVILYEMLTDERPFIGASALEILTNAMTRRRVPPSSRQRDLAAIEGLDRLVLRAIAIQREDRFASMEQFGEAIVACLSSIDETLIFGLPSMTGEASATPASTPRSSRDDDTIVLDPIEPLTLDVSSGEVTKARRGLSHRSWLYSALAVAVVGLALIVIWVGTRRGAEPAEAGPDERIAQQSAEPTHVSPAAVATAPRADAAPKPMVDADTVEAAPVAEPADAAPAEIAPHTVRVTSAPSGATVSSRRRGRLGVTPLDVTLGADDSDELTITLPRHAAETIAVDRATAADVHVSLAPQRVRRPTAKNPPGPTPPKPTIGIKDW